MDPESQRDVVALGMIRDVVIEDAQVSFSIAFATQAAPTKVASAQRRLARRPDSFPE